MKGIRVCCDNGQHKEELTIQELYSLYALAPQKDMETSKIKRVKKKAESHYVKTMGIQPT